MSLKRSIGILVIMWVSFVVSVILVYLSRNTNAMKDFLEFIRDSDVTVLFLAALSLPVNISILIIIGALPASSNTSDKQILPRNDRNQLIRLMSAMQRTASTFIAKTERLEQLNVLFPGVVQVDAMNARDEAYAKKQESRSTLDIERLVVDSRIWAQVDRLVNFVSTQVMLGLTPTWSQAAQPEQASLTSLLKSLKSRTKW